MSETTTSDGTRTWAMIHSERSALAELLDDLSDEQWRVPSLCGGWTVQLAAGHVLAGAEQTGPRFVASLATSGFRFNTMIDRQTRALGALPSKEIVDRLRARTTTTNHPPAPVMAMLGEVVVHGEDIRRPLRVPSAVPSDAATACLDLFKGTNFPVGGKRRVAGLRLIATDMDWSHGTGPEVSGPALSLLLAMTGRPLGLDQLHGEGADALRARLEPGRS